MLARFLKYIDENRLLKRTDRILAAVSGGIDSMVMTDLLLKSKLKFGIAHCNFMLRDEDSDHDEEMVRKFASDHSVPFYYMRFRTKDYAREHGLSIEMAARELRYDWFEKIRSEEGYDNIAVAHNLNDNIETFLLNLIRGTGIAGLSGMRNSGNLIIRPLLFASRKEIEEYCANNGVPYREDRTNEDTKFKRNKIRHEVLPLLKEINPSIESTLIETAERLKQTGLTVSLLMEQLRKEVLNVKADNTFISVNALQSYRRNRTIMFELFRSFGITGSLLQDLENVISGRTGGQLFTETHRILKNRSELIISPLTTKETQEFTFAEEGELKNCSLFSSVKIRNAGKDLKISTDPAIAYLDLGKILFPVTIRKWRKGDFFYPLGMTRRKKLSDHFIDKKYSIPEKEKAMVLETGGKIAWILGDRIDNRFRITKSTAKILILKAQDASGQ